MHIRSRGFTLVEILIVVIILGILAAIVIPQFTNASGDARRASVSSTLQSLRGQIELFKAQHADIPPGSTMLATVLGGKTNPGDSNTTVATGTLGPYVQSFPTNPVSGFSTVANAAGTTAGWFYTVASGQYTFWATDTTGTGTLSY